METLSIYVPKLLLTAGIVLLAIEVLVFGFSTFVLFFLGLSFVVTGVLTWFGVIPLTWTAIVLANALVSMVLAVVLWKPLLKMQGKIDTKRAKTDFHGHRFFVDAEVNLTGQVTHDFSGITWQVKSRDVIPASSEVEVVKVDVGILWVKMV